MARELAPVRRVVTGEGGSGRSRIIADGAAAALTVAERPGYRVSNIWVTGETPAKLKTHIPGQALIRRASHELERLAHTFL